MARSLREIAEDPHLDLADVVSSNLEVKESQGRGRGLFVTKDVKAGQLLMMVKPFASSYFSEKKSRSVSFGPDHFSCGSSLRIEALYNFFASRLVDDPSLLSSLDLLSAGPKYPCCLSFPSRS